MNQPRYWLQFGTRIEGRIVGLRGFPLDTEEPHRRGDLRHTIYETERSKLLKLGQELQPGENRILSEDPITGIITYLIRGREPQ